MFICSLFVNWNQASFLSLTCSLSYILWYLFAHEFSVQLSPILLILAFLFCFIFDLLWVIALSNDFWSYDFQFNDNSLQGLDRFIVVMTYILLVFELVAIITSVIIQLTKGDDPEYIIKN